MNRSKVLVVEDDSEIRELLRDLLECEGFEVRTAENGKKGLDVLDRESERPSVIILDLMMPIMNGWEFLEARRTRFHDADVAGIPVVLVSAAGESTLAGVPSLPDPRKEAQAFVRKPFDFEKLLGVVRRLCVQPSLQAS